MKKILVIDDDQQVRTLLVAFLEEAEFEVIQAEDGEAGVRLAKEHKPDLIVCDVNMPKLDGYGVLRSMHDDLVTATIPFIFLTGKGERDDLRHGMSLGADDYLTKPFKRRELLEAIDARLAKQAAVMKLYSTELREAEERLSYVLNYDALTALPNRLMLRDCLNRALLQASPKRQLAVLSFGLDRFKRVNETLGHSAGDQLLKMVAQRLAQCVHEKDTLARLQADQFAIIVSNVGGQEGASQVAQCMLDSLLEPFAIEGTGIFATASIGISLYPSHGHEIDHLIKNAEGAMNHAKRKGGSTYAFHSPEISTATPAEFSLETDLRYALERNQLEMFYQPQVELQTGSIVGAEALIRWRHPQHGLVSPAKFIPLAEETGLIIPIGEWVLRTSCSQAKVWQDDGFPHCKVATNLSGQIFSQQNLGERLIQVLRETRLNPGTLDVELTESILVKDVSNAISTLSELRELGIRISIDDFGTGYSSLNYLKRFPFDTLKIDQTFIRNVQADSKNAAITIAIIEMAHSLNLKVVAEGVETEDELKFLHHHRCDEVQGYLFSRPLPADEFQRLLSSGKRLQIPY